MHATPVKGRSKKSEQVQPTFRTSPLLALCQIWEKHSRNFRFAGKKKKTLATPTHHVWLSLNRISKERQFPLNRSNIVDQEPKDRQGVNETAPFLGVKARVQDHLRFEAAGTNAANLRGDRKYFEREAPGR